MAPTILAAFDEGLREEATKKFARDGIRLKNNHHVEQVKEASLIIKEEGEVPFGLLVWSTGLAPNPLIESITELKRNEKTHRQAPLDCALCPPRLSWLTLPSPRLACSLEVDGHFRTRLNDGTINEDVYCIGDASALESGPVPATAQVAAQEAKHLAKHLNSQVVSWRSDPGEFKASALPVHSLSPSIPPTLTSRHLAVLQQGHHDLHRRVERPA